MGHLSPIRAFMDPRLLDFEVVYAAAGTPRHIFPISPVQLKQVAEAEIAAFVET